MFKLSSEHIENLKKLGWYQRVLAAGWSSYEEYIVAQWNNKEFFSKVRDEYLKNGRVTKSYYLRNCK